MGSVSYTHLDVYKRQEIGITAENRDVKLTKKGKKIILEKAEDTETIK